MKTWQMIKKLTENPGKRFKSNDYEAYIDDGLLEVTFVANKTDFSIFIDREWEEVKEPVDFITAIESRHKVRVEHPFISHTEKEQFSNHYKVFTELLEIFTREWNAHDVRAVLLEGKWYIED